MSDDSQLATTPLDALHRELGGRMVPFAGYAMPVQYQGIIAEHTHTREQAGLFDVSHMGQIRITAKGGGPREKAAAALEGVTLRVFIIQALEAAVGDRPRRRKGSAK